MITVRFRGEYERRGEPRELQQREPEQRRCRERATQRRDVTSHGGPVWASTRARHPFPWHVIVGSLLEDACRASLLRSETRVPDLRVRSRERRLLPPCVCVCVWMRPNVRMYVCFRPDESRINDVLPFFLIVELFNTGDEKWTTKKRHARPGTPPKPGYLYRSLRAPLLFLNRILSSSFSYGIEIFVEFLVLLLV